MSHHHNHIHNAHRAFGIGVLLNIGFVVVEATYGVISGSLALIADAGHNFSDVLSLLLAWGAMVLATKVATETRTYGFRKVTIMAALASAILLLVALGSIAWEAIERMSAPSPIQGMTVIIVAGVGVVINAATALLFMSGQKNDLNTRGAFLHMVADAAVSLGVVIAGVVILRTGWVWIDPIISLGIVAIILVGTWSLLRDSMNLAIDAVPKGVDMEGIKTYLSTLEHVNSIHDLHVWSMSTTEVALTVHIIMTSETPNDFLSSVQQTLRAQYGIHHATIQIERDSAVPCQLQNDVCL